MPASASMASATLESIAYQTRDVAEAMEADAGIEMGRLRVDGGAVENDFLCQLQSDVIRTEIVRPEVDETTALGAAYAAGLAVGYWDSVEELRDNWRVDRRFSAGWTVNGPTKCTTAGPTPSSARSTGRRTRGSD